MSESSLFRLHHSALRRNSTNFKFRGLRDHFITSLLSFLRSDQSRTSFLSRRQSGDAQRYGQKNASKNKFLVHFQHSLNLLITRYGIVDARSNLLNTLNQVARLQHHH